MPLRPAWERRIFGRIDILSRIAPLFGFTTERLDNIGVIILSEASFTPGNRSTLVAQLARRLLLKNFLCGLPA